MLQNGIRKSTNDSDFLHNVFSTRPAITHFPPCIFITRLKYLIPPFLLFTHYNKLQTCKILSISCIYSLLLVHHTHYLDGISHSDFYPILFWVTSRHEVYFMFLNPESMSIHEYVHMQATFSTSTLQTMS